MDWINNVLTNFLSLIDNTTLNFILVSQGLLFLLTALGVGFVGFQWLTGVRTPPAQLVSTLIVAFALFVILGQFSNLRTTLLNTVSRVSMGALYADPTLGSGMVGSKWKTGYPSNQDNAHLLANADALKTLQKTLTDQQQKWYDEWKKEHDISDIKRLQRTDPIAAAKLMDAMNGTIQPLKYLTNFRGYIQPSTLFDMTLSVTNNMMETTKDWGLDRLGDKILFGMVWLVAVVASLLMIVAYITYVVEFMIVTCFGSLLLPFAVLKPTRNLAERLIGGIITSGMKYLVCLSLVFLFLTYLYKTFSNGFDGTLEALAGVLFSFILFYLLMRDIPNLAASIVSGNPNFGTGFGNAARGSMQAIVQTATAAAFLGASAAQAGAQSVGALVRAGAASSAAKSNAAETGASQSEQRAAGASAFTRSLAGSFGRSLNDSARELSHSIFGNKGNEGYHHGAGDSKSSDNTKTEANDRGVTDSQSGAGIQPRNMTNRERLQHAGVRNYFAYAREQGAAEVRPNINKPGEDGTPGGASTTPGGPQNPGGGESSSKTGDKQRDVPRFRDGEKSASQQAASTSEKSGQQNSQPKESPKTNLPNLQVRSSKGPSYFKR